MSEKTIREFAAELNISKQALHYRIKQLPSKSRQKNRQNIIVLTDEEQMIIKGMLSSTSQTKAKEYEKDIEGNYHDSIVESKQEQIDLLKELLTVKDNRIDNLLNKLDKSNQLLDQQQRLTLALQSDMKALEQKKETTKKWWQIFK